MRPGVDRSSHPPVDVIIRFVQRGQGLCSLSSTGQKKYSVAETRREDSELKSLVELSSNVLVRVESTALENAWVSAAVTA